MSYWEFLGFIVTFFLVCAGGFCFGYYVLTPLIKALL